MTAEHRGKRREQPRRRKITHGRLCKKKIAKCELKKQTKKLIIAKSLLNTELKIQNKKLYL
jgi:hypothetical protein